MGTVFKQHNVIAQKYVVQMSEKKWTDETFEVLTALNDMVAVTDGKIKPTQNFQKLYFLKWPLESPKVSQSL